MNAEPIGLHNQQRSHPVAEQTRESKPRKAAELQPPQPSPITLCRILQTDHGEDGQFGWCRCGIRNGLVCHTRLITADSLAKRKDWSDVQDKSAGQKGPAARPKVCDGPDFPPQERSLQAVLELASHGAAKSVVKV